jgi:ABC-type multidrug transport system fused ATPase/permease subunit
MEIDGPMILHLKEMRCLVDRSAFSRAWDYVGYARTNKWLAILAAAFSGASYILLLILLALFVDLLVSRGEIPPYAHLTEPQRQQFQNDWNNLAPEERLQSLTALPHKASGFPRLTEPAEIGSTEQAIQWNAYVGWLLERRAGPDGASEYRERESANSIGSLAATRPAQLGALSLVVRSRDSFLGPTIAAFVRYNPWMWKPKLGNTPNRSFLAGLLMLACVVAILRAALVGLMHHCASRATLEAVTRMRRLLYHHTYRLGSLTVASTGPNEATSIFTRHVDAVHDGLYARLTVAVREPIKFLFLVIFALSVHFWLALAALCAAGLVWLVGRQTAVYFRRQGRAGARRAADQLALLEESLKMMRLVKGYLMDLFNQGRVERQLSEYSRAQLARFRGELIYRPLLIFLATLAAAWLLFVGGLLVLTGHIDVTCLIVLVTAIVSIYSPVEHWLSHRRTVRRAEEEAVAIFEFLDRRGEVGQVVGAEFLNAMSKRMEFDQVSLREPGSGRLLLDNVMMTIPAGKRVAIVGSDEASKHAFASLIPRFLDPSSGEIRIDGRNLRWVTLDSLRSQVALVMQDQIIFNDTIISNIGCGDPSFSVPQVIEASKLVHAHNFIQRLPYGYETVVGDLGHSLTPGERFRIGLARAVLRDPAIMIVEEPPEQLDDDTKKMLDDAYGRILPGRTVIFLPHRLSTLKNCDHVFVFDGGRLAAEGEHRDLLHSSELYRHLYYLEHYTLSEQS